MHHGKYVYNNPPKRFTIVYNGLSKQETEPVCIDENVSMKNARFKHGTLKNVLFKKEERRNLPRITEDARLPYRRCIRMKDCPMIYRR